MERVTLEISYKNLQHNLDLIKKISNNKSIICVVKDNSYGLGSVEISKFLSKDPCVKGFAVASIDEALMLKTNDISKDIIIISHIFENKYITAIENEFIITISTYEQAIKINNVAKKLNKKAKIEIAIDTGMGRIGFKICDNTLDTIINVSKLDNIEIYGFFSHFSVADHNEDDLVNTDYTIVQEKLFFDLIKEIDNLNIKYNDISISNSAGILTNIGFDLNSSVRPGIILYGILPNSNFKNYDFKPIMQLKSKIIHLKEINEGDAISYGRTFVAKSKMKIATISCGYGDGYPRSASNKANVIINDKKCKIVGRITMDMLMVNVTNVDCNVGDDCILIGESINEKIYLDELCKITYEFSYELLTRINNRVKRIYI